MERQEGVEEGGKDGVALLLGGLDDGEEGDVGGGRPVGAEAAGDFAMDDAVAQDPLGGVVVGGDIGALQEEEELVAMGAIAALEPLPFTMRRVLGQELLVGGPDRLVLPSEGVGGQGLPHFAQSARLFTTGIAAWLTVIPGLIFLVRRPLSRRIRQMGSLKGSIVQVTDVEAAVFEWEESGILSLAQPKELRDGWSA